MFIVLMRHAAAEKTAANKEDRDRVLTPAGEKAFQIVAEMLPALFPHPAYILTSPFTRAQQTAQIVSHSLGDVPIELCSELALPEMEPFLEKCKTKSGVLFAVGHAPYLSDWLFHLTGQEQPLKKGSMAVIAMDGNGKGRLVLYAKPRFCLRLKNGEFPFGQLIKVITLRNQMLKGYCDEERVHRLRVAMRQLNIMLYGIKPLLPHEEYVKVRSDIKGLFGYTDRVRDYDVLLDFIRSAGDFPELLQWISHLKEDKRAELFTVVGEEKTTLALLNIVHLLEPVRIKGDKEIVKNQFSFLVRKTCKQIEEIDITDALALHRLRICCKKLYYFTNIYPFAAKECGRNVADQAKLLKDILGFQHDVFVGRSLLEKTMGAQNLKIQEQSKQVLEQLLGKQMEQADIEKQIRVFQKALAE